MPPTRCLFTILVAIVVLPATAMSASAQGPELDREWREEPRELQFELLSEGFEAESERESDLGEDRLIARYDLEDGRLRVRYISTEPGNETILTMDLVVVAIVEFDDTTGDGRYGFQDEVVQRMALSEMERASVTAEPFVTGGRTATASYSFPEQSSGNNSSLPVGGDQQTSLIPGTFELTFYVVPSPVTIDGSKVAPLDIRFDTTIDRFPFREEGTRVAVETRLSASEPIDAAGWSERTLAARDGFFQTFFSWSRTATVDGNDRAVSVTTLAYGATPTPGTDGTGSDVSVAFAYPRGEKVEHHSVVGVVRTEGVAEEIIGRLVAGDLLLYTLGVVGTLVAVGVPAGLRLRQER